MADYLRVQRNDQNEYRVQIRVEGSLFNALIDTGMTNQDCLVGVGLDRDCYFAVRTSLRALSRIEMEAVGSGAPNLVVAGLATVSIEGLEGSETETHVAEVGDNLLGVCFFQSLARYQLLWEPDLEVMTIMRKPPIL